MSDTAQKPNIFPVLRYQDAPAAIAWLVEAFGFERHAQFPGPDGTIAHAELRFGAGAIAVSSKTPPDATNPWSTVDQGVYLWVESPDAHHERAMAADATIASPLTDRDYGSREYSVRDPEGHLWCLGTYRMTDAVGLPNMSPEIHYDDAPAALAWLERALGFERLVVIPGNHGTILHAELRMGAGVVMLGSSGPPDRPTSEDVRQSVCVVIDDPDRHHAQAVAAGARIMRPLENTHYGARAYTVRDPEDRVWTFGTYQPQL